MACFVWSLCQDEDLDESFVELALAIKFEFMGLYGRIWCNLISSYPSIEGSKHMCCNPKLEIGGEIPKF